MPTFKLADPFVKSPHEKWPTMAHFEDSKREAQNIKLGRLRARYLRDNGPYTARVINRFTRAVSQ